MVSVYYLAREWRALAIGEASDHGTPSIYIAKGAKELKNVKMFETQDPYMKIIVGGQTFKTHVENDGGSRAVWDETFTANLTCNLEREFLYLEVKEKDLLTSTEIGMTKIALRDIPDTRIDSSYEVSDKIIYIGSGVIWCPLAARKGESDQRSPM